MLKRLVREEEGQGLVEYGLILGLVAIVAITALSLMGTSIKDIFNTTKNEISAAKANVDSVAASN